MASEKPKTKSDTRLPLTPGFRAVSGGSVVAADRLYVETDANGDVTAIVSYVGAVVERYAYSPYGAVTVLSASGSAIPGDISQHDWQYLFQGGRLDTATGLYLFEHREYNPSSGVWMQRDPLGQVPDLNEYRFVGNEVTDANDPTGEFLHIGIGIVVGGIVGGWYGGWSGTSILKGAIIGGVGAATGGIVGGVVTRVVIGAGGKAVAGAVAGGAAAGAASSVVTQVATTGTVKRDQLLVDTGIGAVTGGIGGVVRVRKSIPKAAPATPKPVTPESCPTAPNNPTPPKPPIQTGGTKIGDVIKSGQNATGTASQRADAMRSLLDKIKQERQGSGWDYERFDTPDGSGYIGGNGAVVAVGSDGNVYVGQVSGQATLDLMVGATPLPQIPGLRPAQ